jgi:hypothetical protein
VSHTLLGASLRKLSAKSESGVNSSPTNKASDIAFGFNAPVVDSHRVGGISSDGVRFCAFMASTAFEGLRKADELVKSKGDVTADVTAEVMTSGEIPSEGGEVGAVLRGGK